MKRLLLLQSRPEDEVADDEYQSVIAAGVSSDRIHRVRMEAEGVPCLALEDYSAVIVGGGPSNVSDPREQQPAHQREYEPRLMDLIGRIVASDFPYLGVCYGLGVLTAQQGGGVSHRYGEGVGAADIIVTTHGADDPLLKGLPQTFKAYVGHKEAVESQPARAVLLASSVACPVQMYRIGNHVYGAQFHPELTHPSLALRINAYKDKGYFEPHEADSLILEAAHHDVSPANLILRRFVSRYVD